MMLNKFSAMDLVQTLRLCNCLYLGGAAALLLGIVFGAMADSRAVMIAIVVLGICAMAAGCRLCVKRVRCPECEGYLGQMPRMPGNIPNFCPHCGKQLKG